MSFALVGIGSNSSMRETIYKALISVEHVCSSICITSIYKNKALGFADVNFPFYINTVIYVQTNLSLESFHSKLKEIEIQLGRTKVSRECAIDLDLLAFDLYSGLLGRHQLPRITVGEPYYFKCIQEWAPKLLPENITGQWIAMEWPEFYQWTCIEKETLEIRNYIKSLINI